MKLNYLIPIYLCLSIAVKGFAAPSIDYLEKRGLMFASAVDSYQIVLVGNFSLSVTNSERNDIHHVVHHLGKASRENKFKEIKYLATHGSSISAAGDRVRHVPVLQFLAVIFSDSQRKTDMQDIHKKHNRPWNEMKSNVSQNLRDENARGEIMPQLEGFCAHVGIDYNRMKELAERGDWEGFLRALL